MNITRLLLLLLTILQAAAIEIIWTPPDTNTWIVPYRLWISDGTNEAPVAVSSTNRLDFPSELNPELLVIIRQRTLTNWITATNWLDVARTNWVQLTNLITITQTNWVTATNTPPPQPIVELIVNGGFELNTNSWVFTGNVNTFTFASADYAPASGVRAVAYNQGQKLPNGTVSQIIPTVAGRAYTLKFDAGLIAYKKIQQALSVTVQGAATLLNQTVALPNVIATNATYQTVSFPFVADGPRATVTFRDASAGTDAVDLLLDNVSVR
jgi:hypothetical protein